MKKLFSMLFVVVALMASAPAQAQGLKFGVKGGFNITSMDIDKSSTASSVYQMGKENKNGWYIGPSVKLSLAGGLGLDGAIFYDQRITKVGANDDEVKQQFVYVPINLRYNLGLGSNAGIYIAAGPQFGFNVGDTDFDVKDLDDLDGIQQKINSKFQLKKATFGINLGAGIYLFKHLEVGAVYNIPLGNTADIKGDAVGIADNMQKNYDVKSNTFQVSAAIYF